MTTARQNIPFLGTQLKLLLVFLNWGGRKVRAPQGRVPGNPRWGRPRG